MWTVVLLEVITQACNTADFSDRLTVVWMVLVILVMKTEIFGSCLKAVVQATLLCILCLTLCTVFFCLCFLYTLQMTITSFYSAVLFSLHISYLMHWAVTVVWHDSNRTLVSDILIRLLYEITSFVISVHFASMFGNLLLWHLRFLCWWRWRLLYSGLYHSVQSCRRYWHFRHSAFHKHVVTAVSLLWFSTGEEHSVMFFSEKLNCN
jgi:hypothetical protein